MTAAERFSSSRGFLNVGPVTVTAFMTAIDDAQRVRHAHQLEASLGLVSREYSSKRSSAGPITKAGTRNWTR